jgi:hypothetical protein
VSFPKLVEQIPNSKDLYRGRFFIAIRRRQKSLHEESQTENDADDKRREWQLQLK